jgi:hypothetical protein
MRRRHSNINSYTAQKGNRGWLSPNSVFLPLSGIAALKELWHAKKYIKLRGTKTFIQRLHSIIRFFEMNRRGERGDGHMPGESNSIV